MEPTLNRFHYLVGGLAEGTPVHETAWDLHPHGSGPRGLTVLAAKGPRVIPESEPVPFDQPMEVIEYHCIRAFLFGRHKVDAFLWDQIAYSGQGIAALEDAIIGRATRQPVR